MTDRKILIDAFLGASLPFMVIMMLAPFVPVLEAFVAHYPLFITAGLIFTLGPAYALFQLDAIEDMRKRSQRRLMERIRRALVSALRHNIRDVAKARSVASDFFAGLSEEGLLADEEADRLVEEAWEELK